ncbi:hypothetical protein SAMN05421636_10466 [Pricia antarctica]|uniref:Uncharacterized protein n=1 Tax=Pricia antarctica TaxID=641691 RepID=A0A1G7BA92_9FLAO|nr:hypothetical protein [Pricia antarctica]SDE23797.1 hypothetical protein SAMN05421636_10466 [Pricia antarctica]
MEIKTTEQGVDTEAMTSLELRLTYDKDLAITATNIDRVLDQNGKFGQLYETINLHRQAGLESLFKRRFSDTFNPAKFRWPEYLFIPTAANGHDYWISSPPDNHRYALAWKSPNDGPNTASVETGNLFVFGQLHNEGPTDTQSSTAAIGVFYEPSMTLGVVDFQPSVHFKAEFRTALEYFPALSAGGVHIYAELLLACWQKIPGPQEFDLIGVKHFDVATSGRRDQSFGPELQQIEKSLDGPELSAPFVVERGRKYLFAVTGRITVASNLISSDGKPLPVFSSSQLKVWGSLNCLVPQMNIYTKRVDIP